MTSSCRCFYLVTGLFSLVIRGPQEAQSSYNCISELWRISKIVSKSLLTGFVGMVYLHISEIDCSIAVVVKVFHMYS